jgi:hydrogenase nickel incorporation protein HypA/HybF
MHELSLCGAIADIAMRQAGPRRVDAVHVRIGDLRQVVPGTLEFCWSMVVSGTELESAALEVERVPAVLRCLECEAQHGMADAIAFVCACCGSVDVVVVAGEEFLVTALDLEQV